jgi:ankyrin repeat protein/DNA-directed RNA polymerase specialized sigma24 family protein
MTITPMRSTDDAPLAQAVAGGGPGALDALNLLIARHVHFVHSACLRQLGDPSLADQATAATFVLLARHAARLSRKRSLIPWLFDTAWHACRAIRKLSRATRASSPAAAPTFQIGTLPGQVYVPPTDWSALAAHVDDDLARLPANNRDAVLLKYFANLPLRDVADAMNVSDMTAGQRISAGVARFRARLERRNISIGPESLVAAIQAHATQLAPAHVVANAMAAIAGALQPAPSPTLPAAVADQVGASLARAKWLTIAYAACVFLLAAIVSYRLVTLAKSGRLFAATQPAATQSIDAANVNPQTPTPRHDKPAPVLPSITTPAPQVKPARPVDSELAGRFIQAIRLGEFDAVERMASEEEGLINATDPKTGRTAIQIAADLVAWKRGDATRIAHFLIDNGADVDVHTAARAGHADQVARLLLQDLSRLNSRDERGLTVLQRAALIDGVSPDCEQVVDMLIQAGARVDIWTACTFALPDPVQEALDNDPRLVNAPLLGATPLHWAARPRRYTEDPLAIPKLLIDKGADVMARDASRDGMTALHHAAEWGAQPALAQLLLDKGLDVNVPDDFGWTPTDYAVSRARREMVDFLTSKGGKRTTIDSPNQPLKTPRMFAAVMAGDEKLTKVLLDDTPELAKTRGSTGQTPLHHAAAGGYIGIIDLLLADRADINAQETNKYGGTPLHWAVRHDRLDAVRHLLAKGADPKATNARNGQTLLHTAAQHTDDAALIHLLLSKDIDPRAKDRFGKTALDYAQSANHPNAADRLKSAP